MSSPVTFPAPMDLHNLRNATLLRDPWTHAIVTDTFVNPEVTATLMGTYPTTGFTRLTQADADKNFDMEARNDVTMRDLDDPCPWQTLLRQLNGPAYRTAMQDLTGLNLTAAILKVAFYRYGPNCWFGPHRDDERKFVSHIIYCNPHWPTDAGGHLLINRSNNMDDVHSKVAPQAGTSVVVVRSDTSWHSIEPVSAQHGRCRRSLIAHFYKPGSDVDFYDR